MQQMSINFEKPKIFFDGPPELDPDKRHNRLLKQHEVIRDYMLSHRQFKSVPSIHRALESQGHFYPENSISAQLRHLRKLRFGSFQVDKRHKGNGLWEYRVKVSVQC